MLIIIKLKIKYFILFWFFNLKGYIFLLILNENFCDKKYLLLNIIYKIYD